jgi:hypothetical protein
MASVVTVVEASNHSLAYRGKAVSGRGKAAKQISVLADEIANLTQCRVYPGTLNIVLEQPLLLDDAIALKWDNGGRLLWPAKLEGKPVWLYRWASGPLHIAEIVAEQRLRDHLDIKDAHVYTIEVDRSIVVPHSKKAALVWHLLWWRRGHWHYKYAGYALQAGDLGHVLGAAQGERGSFGWYWGKRKFVGRLRQVIMMPYLLVRLIRGYWRAADSQKG